MSRKKWLVGLGLSVTVGAQAQYTTRVYANPGSVVETTVVGAFNGGPVGNIYSSTHSVDHAGVWSASTGQFQSYTPANRTGSKFTGFQDGYFLGSVRGRPMGYSESPTMWEASTGNVVDLTTSWPGDFQYLNVTAKLGNRVGANGSGGIYGDRGVGVLWQDYHNPEVFTIMHSTVAAHAFITSIDGNDVVGVGDNEIWQHAHLWRNGSTTQIDLNPTGYSDSVATSASGGVQAGYGRSNSQPGNHALMWTGSASSVVDLHPAGYQRSYVEGMRGNTMLGFASLTNSDFGTAFLWDTSGNSLNLGQFLPTGYFGSKAVGMDENGVISGIAYTTGTNGNAVPVTWTPVPEPSTFLVLGVAGLLARKRKTKA